MWEWFMPPINMVTGGWFMIYGIVLPTLLLLFAYLHHHLGFTGFTVVPNMTPLMCETPKGAGLGTRPRHCLAAKTKHGRVHEMCVCNIYTHIIIKTIFICICNVCMYAYIYNYMLYCSMM